MLQTIGAAGYESVNAEFERLPAKKIIQWAVDTFNPYLCLSASMTDAVLIDLAVKVDPGIEVVFIDTGYHFPETLDTVVVVRRRYGLNRFGQSCLLARRLIESDVRFVMLNLGGWDMHGKIFEACDRMLMPLDKATDPVIVEPEHVALGDEPLMLPVVTLSSSAAAKFLPSGLEAEVVAVYVNGTFPVFSTLIVPATL